MGPVATGLVIGAVAAFWHQLSGLVTSVSRRQPDEETQAGVKPRMTRAA
jgi:hypothetical protein